MQVVVIFAAAGLTALAVYLMVVGRSMVLPLVLAVFASHLINALASLTRRIRIFGRPPDWPVRAGASLIVVFIVGWLVINLLVNNGSHLMAAAPTYEGRVRLLLTKISEWMGVEQPAFLERPFERGRLTVLISGVALSLTGMIGGFATVIVYTVFLLLEEHSIDRKIAALFPDAERRALAHRILHQIGAEIQTYVWLKTVLSTATTLASYAVMKWVGLDMAEFWALLIFVLNFIPFIGAWSGVIFPALLTLMQFDTPGPIVVLVRYGIGLSLGGRRACLVASVRVAGYRRARGAQQRPIIRSITHAPDHTVSRPRWLHWLDSISPSPALLCRADFHRVSRAVGPG